MRLPNTIAIYGIGLMGGSLGLALKSLNNLKNISLCHCEQNKALSTNELKIIGIGRNEEKLKRAKELGAIDEFSISLEAVSPAKLCVICVPVSLTPNILENLLPYMQQDAIVTDVGSSKSLLVKKCEQIAGTKIRFVGSHPMAGSDKVGAESAKPDLYKNSQCIITKTLNTNEDSFRIVQNLWQTVGCNILTMTPEDHDKLVCPASHLPHVACVALVALLEKRYREDKRTLNFVSTGFQDTTRIARGEENLWRDICIENKDNLIKDISDYINIMDTFISYLQNADATSIEKFFAIYRNFRMSLDKKY